MPACCHPLPAAFTDSKPDPQHLGSVSYTHLDVYKRQDSPRVGRPAAPLRKRPKPHAGPMAIRSTIAPEKACRGPRLGA